MNIENWINSHTESLSGKKAAVTGSTGGIGRELCRRLANLGADLILVNRNSEKSRALGDELRRDFPNIKTEYVSADLEDIDSVKSACGELSALLPDALILNAGAYSIPRHKCSTGYDNVFQINFASHYYIVKELLPVLREKDGRVIAVGSIAHNYSNTDPGDVDFSTRARASRVYGNSKRYLMFSLYELFRREERAKLAVAHPGITFTNITSHYPKPVFALIKHPMKVIFMKPETACLSILEGMFDCCGYHEWIGPSLFDVWGIPAKRKLSTCSEEESQRIFETAERVYEAMKKGD